MNPHTCPTKITTPVLDVLRKRAPLALALILSSLTARGALMDGLVSYWPLDDSSGGVATDLSFNNNLIIAGTPVVSAGQFSNAFTLGTGIYLTNVFTFNNNDTGLPVYGAGTYTVAMWVKGPAQTARYLYTEGNTTTANPILVIQTGQVAANNGKFDVILRNTRNQVLINHAVSTNVVFDDTWHHVAWVDDRGNVSLYIDGVLDPASSSFNYVWSHGDLALDTVSLGTLLRNTLSATTVNFAGQLDEVATWERALSQLEVEQVRTNGVFAQGTDIPARPVTLSKVPADTVKNLGEWHLLSVDAGGTRPLTYQWSMNGSPILDATNRVYRAINFQTNNTGDFYSCAATNPLGFAVTTNATFTVVNDSLANPTNGLVNYWPLDVFNENTNTPDLHFGHGFQMVGMNTNFDIVPGQFSNAAAFFAAPAPGTYGYRTSGSPIYSRTNYTVSLWVNSAILQNDRRVFSEGRDAGNNNPLFTLGTDNLGLTPSFVPFVRPDAGAGPTINARLSTRPVFDGTWHHVVWTDANGQGKLYIDGNLDETDYFYRRPTNITLNITYIGVTARTTAANVPAPVTPYTGSIDEVATWDRVLSWTEIQMIRTNGVPVPTEVVLAPTITTQPPQRTNNVFVGDTVNFPVQVNGTPPFNFQWRKDGAAISGGINPSAQTDTLSLTNVQLVDSNTTYTVVVVNPAGSVTSAVARLYVSNFAPITNGEVLNMDVGLTASPNPQPGFQEFTLAENPATFANGVRVTVTGIGAPLADRNRVTGNMVVNNPPDMTQAQIYNDFIFANNGTGDGTGMSVLIERLATNVSYGLTIWSFDPQSAGTRVADWVEMSSGAPIPIVTDHTFDGRVLPTNNFQYTFGGLLTSSASGTLQLDGLRKPTSVGTDGITPSFGVFINALRLAANPVATGITRGTLAGGNLRLTTETEYPGMTPNLEQTTNLVSGTWVPAVGGTVIESVGPVVVVEFPINPTENLFYRGKRKP